MPHAKAVLGNGEEYIGEDIHTDLFSAMASSFDMLRKYEKAYTMHRKEPGSCKQVLGDQHPNILGSMNNLALVLGMRGSYKSA
jgi:hypothetical protein